MNLVKSAFPRYRSITYPFKVLGVETSCDDTCLSTLLIPTSSSAPIQNTSIVRRSLEYSEPYGGIVPNIVGRFHATRLAEELFKLRMMGELDALNLIAVTRGIFL